MSQQNVLVAEKLDKISRTRLDNVVKLPYFQEGEDGQEDPVEVEKKEELREEANTENMVAVDRLIDCTQ